MEKRLLYVTFAFYRLLFEFLLSEDDATHSPVISLFGRFRQGGTPTGKPLKSFINKIMANTCILEDKIRKIKDSCLIKPIAIND